MSYSLLVSLIYFDIYILKMVFFCKMFKLVGVSCNPVNSYNIVSAVAEGNSGPRV